MPEKLLLAANCHIGGLAASSNFLPVETISVAPIKLDELIDCEPAPASPEQRITTTVAKPEPDSATVVVSTLDEWAVTPGSVLKPNESQLERLAVEHSESYPAAWDEPSPPDAVPTIKQTNFFEWQRNYPPFNQLGLASLPSKQ